MRHLRNKLILRLRDYWTEQTGMAAQARVRAITLAGYTQLLAAAEPMGLRCRSITHGKLHRHILMLRCPDQAFYLDAIRRYLSKRELHPLGQDIHIIPAEDTGTEQASMLIGLHLSATLSPDIEPIKTDLCAILTAVQHSIQDFTSMTATLEQWAADMEQANPDAAALLRWMNDGHYLLLGMQNTEQSLGLCQDPALLRQIAGPTSLKHLSNYPQTEAIEWLHLDELKHCIYLDISLDAVRLTRHINGHKEHLLLLGHFSRSARHCNASQLPLWRLRWQALSQHPSLKHSSYYQREVLSLFNHLPKPVLLSIHVQELAQQLKTMTDLSDPRLCYAAQHQLRPGNMSQIIAFIPSDRFGQRILQNLMTALGKIGIQVLDQYNARIDGHQLLCLQYPSPDKTISDEAIRQVIYQQTSFWKDHARLSLLHNEHIEDLPKRLKQLTHVPSLYQEQHPPEQWYSDILLSEWVEKHQRSQVRIAFKHGIIQLHFFSHHKLILGDLVASLHQFGLQVLEESVAPIQEQRLSISTIRCQHPNYALHINPRLAEALNAILNQQALSDPLNALILTGGLNCLQTGLLIALRNHLCQIMAEAAPSAINHALCTHPAIALPLLQMIEARHRPAMPASMLEQAKLAFKNTLQDVPSLNHDRWFRCLAALAHSIESCNAWTRSEDTPLAMKIMPRKLSFMPEPKPYREIFVQGIHMQGVHLRAGPIARGGLRYSDRHADYRTEVLELMATQTIKNGQIIPTGAKGGFIVLGKPSPEDVKTAYQQFIAGLLAVTDAPEQEHADAYLVVAADKGTARFSDTANDLALEKGFWMGDAFASGGKHGYDHKVIGITARGAWVAASHQLGLMGIDANKDPIRIVGIGDMSGDVFGNGMLINPNIQLIAAFNHRHILLDPNPNSEQSFAERQRLFREAKDWSHYQQSCISEGGGVFDRQAKEIQLSDQARTALDIEDSALSGHQLIQAMLKAPVHMLYNGGIGTYIKASHEQHSDVQDPSNNAVRVDANQLRCQLICEGGNLGVSQAARLEFARLGGQIQSDAIDNAAGVNMSDHEVNVKLLLGQRPSPERNAKLKRFTDSITAQCLDDNLWQSRALSLAQQEAIDFSPRTQKLRQRLLDEHYLSDSITEDIHDDSSLLLKPQLAVLLGQEKNRLHHYLQEQSFIDNCPFRQQLLYAYFPASLQKASQQHPLHDNLIASCAANLIINHYGLHAVSHLQALVSCSVQSICDAILTAAAFLDAERLIKELWHSAFSPQKKLKLHRHLQEQVLRFAEEWARLSCHCQPISLTHIQDMRQALQTAKPESLDMAFSRLSLLSRRAPALAQNGAKQWPAQVQALEQALHCLSIHRLEEPLRTPAWAQDEDHLALRREWLHRLTHMKVKAMQQLLKKPKATQNWQQHRHWQTLQAIPEQASNMQQLLSLTQLAGLIDECDQ